MFYCLVAGSRTFNDYALLKNKLDAILSNHAPYVTIVSGGAKGADALAEQYADECGYEKKIFFANWDLYGKRAGYLRNRQMHEYISQFENRGIVCFWNGKSKGTSQNFQLAKEFNNQIKIVRFE